MVLIQCLVVAFAVITTVTNLPMRSGEEDFDAMEENNEKRQWDTTCSYWRWSKCRGKAKMQREVSKYRIIMPGKTFRT